MRTDKLLSALTSTRFPEERRSGVVLLHPGNVLVEVEDASGVIQRFESRKNRVVAAGRNVLRDLLLNVGPAPGYIAVGQGSTAAADTDTQLETEVFRGPVTRRDASASLATFKLFISTSEANGNTLREVGLFVSATFKDSVPLGGGTLFARATITPIVKTTATQVTFTWDFPIVSA